MKLLVWCLFVSMPIQLLNAKGFQERKLATIEPDKSIVHARELLGESFYRSPVAKTLSSHQELEKSLEILVRSKLAKKYQYGSREIAHTIIIESSKYHLDPFFVAAVIEGESSFKPRAIGSVGERGLMQIRPSTAKWVANKFGIKWRSERALFDPNYNIKIGTAYLSLLREKFEKNGQFYLAAYNMGPGSVRLALAKNIKPRDYPKHVMKRYLAFYRNLSP